MTTDQAPDPRREILYVQFATDGEPISDCQWWISDTLKDLAAADRAAGIVRVATLNPAVVERVARLMFMQAEINEAGAYATLEAVNAKWDLCEESCRSVYEAWRHDARAVLAALGETE